MDVFAPHIAKKAEPGQFVILRASDDGERIPLTVADFDREKGIVTIILDNVSLYDNQVFNPPVTSTITPKLEVVGCDTTGLSPNKIRLGEGGWITANEIDEEDIIALESKRAEQISKNAVTQESNRRNITTPARTSSVSSVDLAYRISNINSKDALTLQNQTGRTNFIGDNIGEEYIDLLTGNLIVTETDLVLPGVDGLDLNLSRYYILAQAEAYTKSAGIVTRPTTFTLQEGMYVVTEEVYNWETGQTSRYYYPYFEQEDADKRVNEIISRDTHDGIYMYDAWWDISNINMEEFLYKQPTLTKVTYDNSLNYTYDSYVYNEFSTAFNKTFGKPLILTEEIDYDTFLDSDREKHAMLYTYDDDTGFMLSKSWYKSASSKCSENYTYDANNRLSSVRLADGTTTSYSIVQSKMDC